MSSPIAPAAVQARLELFWRQAHACLEAGTIDWRDIKCKVGGPYGERWLYIHTDRIFQVLQIKYPEAYLSMEKREFLDLLRLQKGFERSDDVQRLGAKKLPTKCCKFRRSDDGGSIERFAYSAFFMRWQPVKPAAGPGSIDGTCLLKQFLLMAEECVQASDRDRLDSWFSYDAAKGNLFIFIKSILADAQARLPQWQSVMHREVLAALHSIPGCVGNGWLRVLGPKAARRKRYCWKFEVTQDSPAELIQLCKAVEAKSAG